MKTLFALVAACALAVPAMADCHAVSVHAPAKVVLVAAPSYTGVSAAPCASNCQNVSVKANYAVAAPIDPADVDPAYTPCPVLDAARALFPLLFPNGIYSPNVVAVRGGYGHVNAVFVEHRDRVFVRRDVIVHRNVGVRRANPNAGSGVVGILAAGARTVRNVAGAVIGGR